MKYPLLIANLIFFILGGFSPLPVLARTCYPVVLSLGPYAGFDFQLRKMGFEQGYGDNIFETQYPQGNFFVGLMFTEFLGLELGYEKTLNKTRNSRFTAGDMILGNMAIAGTSGQFKSHGQVYGPHINIIGIYQLCQEYPFEIFGSIGAAYLTAKFDRNLVELNGIPRANRRSFEREKTIWRAAVGAQYLLADCIGLRASLGFENTSQMNLFSREPVSNPSEIKLKDSLLLGLGLFYVF